VSPVTVGWSCFSLLARQLPVLWSLQLIKTLNVGMGKGAVMYLTMLIVTELKLNLLVYTCCITSCSFLKDYIPGPGVDAHDTDVAMYR
jgi:hypothetical protein